MSPRTRLVPDSEVLAATARVIGRIGPVRLTLADVAAEAGIAPATLIQRFGSKRGLLLELARKGVSESGNFFTGVRQNGSRVEDLITTFSQCCEAMAPDAATLSNHLAFLQIDLTDKDFHALALAQAKSFHDQIREFLDEMVRAKELKPCDTGALARVIQLGYGGSMLQWAIERQGKVGDCVRRDLEFILEPYLITDPTRGRRKDSSPKRPKKSGNT